MSKRINIILPDKTVAVLDRVASRGTRSRFIDRAVRHYVETEGMARLREQLKTRLSRYQMIKDIRGLGMMSAVEFQPPRKFRFRILFETFSRIHPAMFGQVLVMRLFRDHRIYSQICGNNFMVLKVAPTLVITEAQLDEFVDAMEAVVKLMHTSTSFWTEAIGMARRVINVI